MNENPETYGGKNLHVNNDEKGSIVKNAEILAICLMCINAVRLYYNQKHKNS